MVKFSSISGTFANWTHESWTETHENKITTFVLVKEEEVQHVNLWPGVCSVNGSSNFRLLFRQEIKEINVFCIQLIFVYGVYCICIFVWFIFFFIYTCLYLCLSNMYLTLTFVVHCGEVRFFSVEGIITSPQWTLSSVQDSSPSDWPLRTTVTTKKCIVGKAVNPLSCETFH